MKLVIVESPAKAKTINKYLGKEYKVIASYGHVRDLPSKDGSVDVKNDFAFKWQSDDTSQKHIKNILDNAKNADEIYLATDPDREGEAISWHVYEIIHSSLAYKPSKIKRIIFYEITKKAIQQSLLQLRDLNQALIDAYLTRRALDYLFGFTLSPILWRKLPGSRSAGRVQSVALRLLTEREIEIEKFVTTEYWSLIAHFKTPSGSALTARLIQFDGEKLSKFSVPNQAQAENIKQVALESVPYSIAKIEKKQTQRKPSPPFITSTLQQEASRKYGFSVSSTMRIAQRLYEGVSVQGENRGLITYMRTDSVNLSTEAVEVARNVIKQTFGNEYLPAQGRVYNNTAKNAQEAHEAIRPTDFTILPSDLKGHIEDELYKLYDLIWKRALASQMTNALINQTSIDICDPDKKITWRASGSTIEFNGFLALYQEGKDEENEDEEEGLLPQVAEGDATDLKKIDPLQHFTQPPPRYTEATLVKRMEELGIGRPSTYASIIKVLQDRSYARLEKRQFIPEDRGRIVTAFLVNYFKKYVEYNFTSDLEQRLDDISSGNLAWRDTIKDFWQNFSAATEEINDLTITQVLDTLNEELASLLFNHNGKIDRSCQKCGEGQLSIKIGKFGAFIGCSNYPECNYTRPLSGNEDEQNNASEASTPVEPQALGEYQKQTVSLKKGPYGFYLQLGEGKKPKRAPIPKHLNPANIELETAIKLLDLPREIGKHPDTGEAITTGYGRFGPYLLYQGKFISLRDPAQVLELNVVDATKIISAKQDGKASEKRPRKFPQKKTPSRKTKAAPKKPKKSSA